ncbi:MAG: hypothetical protein ACNYPH_01040 [Gammaproteobacteria bacterium WSBS_2016_MAG_OTU1]
MEVKFIFAVSKTSAAIICVAGVAVHGIMFIITAPAAVCFIAALSLIGMPPDIHRQ